MAAAWLRRRSIKLFERKPRPLRRRVQLHSRIRWASVQPGRETLDRLALGTRRLAGASRSALPSAMPQTTISSLGMASSRRTTGWKRGEDRPRAGIEAVPLRRDQQVLEEHAEVEPGADLEGAVDGDHQRDGRAEEAKIGLGLPAHPRPYRPGRRRAGRRGPSPACGGARDRARGRSRDSSDIPPAAGRSGNHSEAISAVFQPGAGVRTDDPGASRAACWCRTAPARRGRSGAQTATDRPDRAGTPHGTAGADGVFDGLRRVQRVREPCAASIEHIAKAVADNLQRKRRQHDREAGEEHGPEGLIGILLGGSDHSRPRSGLPAARPRRGRTARPRPARHRRR